MKWVFDDGGRAAGRFKPALGDCVARSIAIVSQRPYGEVARDLDARAKGERYRRGKMGFLAATGRGSNSRRGVYKVTYAPYILSLGLIWRPTMFLRQGCKVHLRTGELPAKGRLLVKCSKHLTAVIDGVIHDTHDPSRGGTRCVYGYWALPEVA